MKRNNTGAPAVPVMVHRFNRPPPISCKPCREKKRRCDRSRPSCSSCSQRGISCEYSGQDRGSGSGSSGNNGPSQLNPDEVLSRLQKLEEAVFSRPTMTISSRHGHDGATEGCTSTPFSLHREDAGEDLTRDASITTARLVKQLPPMHQAIKLFDHFVLALNPSHNILHIPSARDALKETYKNIQVNDEAPSRGNLLLLFSILAGASIAWTRELLEALDATPENAKAAFKAFAHAAKLVLDDASAPIQPPTTALAATATLAHVLFNSDDGFPLRMLELRHRCLVMMRRLQLHRLDTVKSREERSATECNWIDIEVQRRIWWHMVASDWLGGFSGSLMEGIYTFQPRQMNVRVPVNIDDELLSASGETPGLPLSTPTAMSSFLQRLKLADLCRRIVDELPAPVDTNYETLDYRLVVDIDRRLRQYLDELPVFFRLDPASILQSEKICKERPYIAWQRIMAHFSVHARICHLHRPYHLEGARNPQFHYSRNACTESAYKVLELRRLMDEQGENSAFRPERFWVIMQHVFMASLTLATDVSFNPDAPDAEARKENVMSAYRILERSKQESSVLVEGLQRNMQTLLETLRPKTSSSAQLPRRLEDTAETRTEPATFNQQSLPSFPVQDVTHSGEWDLDSANMDQTLSEFLAVVPDLDMNQWMSLVGDLDVQSGIAWDK